MGLSAIGQKALETEQEKAKRPGLSPIGMKAIEMQESQELFGDTLPNMGTANSTSPTPVGPSTMDFAKEIPQGITRTVATVGISAGNLAHRVVGREAPFEDEIQTTGSPITEAIFGKTPIKTFKKYGEAGIEFVDDATGLKIDKAFAPFYAVAGVALDLSGTGGGAKNLFRSLHSAKTFEDAATIMRTAGFDDDVVKDYAPIFAKTTAKEETSQALEAALKLQNTTKKINNSPLRVIDESEPITVGGKVFSDEVRTLRESTVKLFDEVPVEKMTPEISQLRSTIKRTETPSIEDFTNATRALEGIGVKVDELQSSLDDLRNTVKTEPGRFDADITEVPKIEGKVEEVKVLDEIADPAREKLGVLSVQVQERFGKATVTKGKAAKFTENEGKVFNEVYRYAEEARHIADNQNGVGEMVQSMPKWIPEDLRSPVLFERVTDMLRKGEVPTSHGTPETRLYTEMVDETARRAGILSKTAKQAVSPETAIVQAMRERTGDAPAYPIEGKAPVSKELGDALENETVSVDLANDEYLKYDALRHEQDPKLEKNIQKIGIEFKGLEDTTKFMSVARDVYRNSEKVFGEHWPKVKEMIFDPFDAAKGRMVDEEKGLTDSLYSEVVEKLGIKKKSKESAAVMDFGEGVKRYDDLVTEFGKEKADNIVEAAKWFRAQYDRMLDEVNTVRARIYPEQEDKLIPKRANYFRHYEELSQNWGGLKNAFEDTNLGNMAPSMIELGEDGAGAKSKWLSFAQKRLGKKSERDAVGGFLNYVPNFAYAKHIDPQTSKIRGLIKVLIQETEKSKNLNNYIAGMRKWADDLAGLANFVDRFAEHAPGGRKGLDVLDYLNKRAKRNAILGNIGTALSQSFNVPNGIAVARAHSVRGMLRSFGDVVHYGDEGTAVAWKDSDFIKERYKNSMYDKFSVGFFEKSSDMAGWLISVLDEAGTKFIWNSMYEKGLHEGVADAVKYADDLTRKTVAGRGVGEVPLVQKSKVFQMVAPFQLEVANAWHVMGDKDPNQFAKFATLFAAMYVWNQAAEEVTGSEVTMNPYEAFYESYQIAVSEGTIKEKGMKVTGRVLGEALSGLPMGNYVGATFAGVSGMDEKAREEFFSESGDPVRYGTAPLLYRAATNPVFMLLPAWGGRQIEKTIGGIGALADGEVRGPDGAPLMDVKPGVAGAVQNILFGKWAPNIAYEKELEEEMMSLYKENAALVKKGEPADIEMAQKNVDELNEKMWPIYKRVAAEGRAEDEKRRVREMKPTVRAIDALLSEKKNEEAQKVVDAMTEEEYKIYVLARKNERAEEEERDKESTIKEAVDYAYAFGTNPVQAFNIVFKNHEIIEDTKGGVFTGVVRTRRITKEQSEAIKKELGHKSGDSLILEHKLPLGLGGSNQMTNLELVPADKHDSWTPVEVFLIEAMKDKKIGWEQAQELILRHKGYEGEPISFEDIQKIVEAE